MRGVAALIVVMLVASLALAPLGCGGEHRTVRTETVYDADDDDGGRRVERRVETVEDDDDGDSGIVGGTVGFVGDVVALPFRAVGGLIDVIF
jgi:hypothetical protein